MIKIPPITVWLLFLAAVCLLALCSGCHLIRGQRRCNCVTAAIGQYHTRRACERVEQRLIAVPLCTPRKQTLDDELAEINKIKDQKKRLAAKAALVRRCRCDQDKTIDLDAAVDEAVEKTNAETTDPCSPHIIGNAGTVSIGCGQPFVVKGMWYGEEESANE